MVPYHIKESDLEGFEILMKQSWDWIYIKIRITRHANSRHMPWRHRFMRSRVYVDYCTSNAKRNVVTIAGFALNYKSSACIKLDG